LGGAFGSVYADSKVAGCAGPIQGKLMIRALVLTAALAVGLGAAFAQSDPIAARRQIMKNVGAATGLGTKFVKGEEAFDLAKAKQILETYAVAADKTHTYYPDTSKTGGETTASPKIWESQADFRKRFDDWSDAIKKASANVKDLDTFKTEFSALTRSCGSCHQAYRIQRS
jgi:cytochrome c556